MSTLSVLRSLLRLMSGRALGARLDVAGAVGWEVIGIALGVAGPFFLKLVVDALSEGQADPALLATLIIAFVVAWSGTSIITSFKYVHTTRIINKLARHLLGQAVRAQLPVIARERSGDTGRVLGLFERLPQSLQIVIDGLLWRAAPLVIQVAISLAVISALVPFQYVLMMAAVLAAYLVAANLGAARFAARARTANDAAGALSQSVGDVLRNARRIVFNGNLDSEVEMVRTQASAKLDANDKTAWALVRLSALQYGVVGFGLTILLVLGGADVIAGRLTVGDFVLLQAYAFRLALPISGFGYVLRQAGVSIANIADALDLAAAEERDTPSAAAYWGAAPVALERIGFRYGGGPWALRDVSARIPAGAFVAIVGPNGSGKSTLAQLIAGHLDPNEGTVRIDDADLAAVPRALRHRLVLYVPQYIGLFNRSLRSNALYPPSELTVDELTDLLNAWGFYDGRRPVDVDLLVGEQGERLSGGQIQKLELARLAGVRAPVMILDESTSQLDGPSEASAIATLRERFRGDTTLLLVTHRQRLVETADLVLFVQNGRLAGAGKHGELAAQVPAYARLWAPSPGSERVDAAMG